MGLTDFDNITHFFYRVLTPTKNATAVICKWRFFKSVLKTSEYCVVLRQNIIHRTRGTAHNIFLARLVLLCFKQTFT
jgi:hypothetical protein